MLTEKQERFIRLSTQREELKEQLKTSGEELEELLAEIGIGAVFQDREDNTVFEIVEPTGTYVSFRKLGYNRTKREGERSGTLSVKRAKELGFDV